MCKQEVRRDETDCISLGVGMRKDRGRERVGGRGMRDQKNGKLGLNSKHNLISWDTIK